MTDKSSEDRIAYVISKLQSSNSSKAYSGLVEIRSRIIKTPNGVSTLLNLGGLVPLLNQLRKTSGKLMDITLSILGNLSLEPEFRSLVRTTSLSDDLIHIIKTIRDESILCRAYRTVGNLAEDSSLSAELNDLSAPEMIIEALIGHKLFVMERTFAAPKRRSDHSWLKMARAVDPSSTDPADEAGGEATSKLKNEEAIQMAVRALRQLGDSKKHRISMVEEGLVYVLAEALKSENLATVKTAIKAYEHFLAADDSERLMSRANKKVNNYLGSNKFVVSKSTDAYIAFLTVNELGCKRLLQLCEYSDKKLQDSALALVCKLSRQKEFRSRLGEEAITLFLKKLQDKPKGTKGWMNLIHSLAFFAREHQPSMKEKEALPVLHSAMVDQALPEELRHFILNAFVQFSFFKDSLIQLYKMGLHRNLLEIIEDYTVNNKFEGCFNAEVTEQAAAHMSDNESMSENESSEPKLRREKSFRISSPSYLAIEKEIRQLKKEEEPEIYNLWGIPTSSDVGSLPVSPRSEGGSSPLSLPSSPHQYSPTLSPCSTPPLSPSEDLFSGFEFASEPEDNENDDIFSSDLDENDEECPKKKVKLEEVQKPDSDITLLLIKSSDLKIRENEKRTEIENFPLFWCLALLIRFQWMGHTLDERSDLDVLRVLTEYSRTVKEPLRRSGKIMARIAGKHDIFGSILCGKHVQKLAHLMCVCKCQRHSLQADIGTTVFTSLSEVAASAIGIHSLRRLLRTKDSCLATSLPFLSLEKRDMVLLFKETFGQLETMVDLLLPEAVMAVCKYGRDFFPYSSPVKPQEASIQSVKAPCCVGERNITFVTETGEVTANRRKLTENNEVFNAMLTRFHSEERIPWGETGFEVLQYLIHYISGCRKNTHSCVAVKVKSSCKPALLRLADAYGITSMMEELVNEMTSSKPSVENVVEVYKSVCMHEYPGCQVKRVQLFRTIVDSDGTNLITALLKSDAKSHFVLTIKDAVLSSLS